MTLFPLMSMGGQSEGLACADQGAMTLIGVSGNFTSFLGSTPAHIVCTPAHIACTPAHIICTPAHIVCKAKIKLTQPQVELGKNSI
jgi:hypothetical protein